VTRPRKVEIFVRRRLEPDLELKLPSQPNHLKQQAPRPAPPPIKDAPTHSAGEGRDSHLQYLRSHQEYRSQPLWEEVKEPGAQDS